MNPGKAVNHGDTEGAELNPDETAVARIHQTNAQHQSIALRFCFRLCASVVNKPPFQK
jgi:hypothetical protein